MLMDSLITVLYAEESIASQNSSILDDDSSK